MSTPKDSLYKQRQAELRALNKYGYKIPKGVKPGDFKPNLTTVLHANKLYTGAKGK